MDRHGSAEFISCQVVMAAAHTQQLKAFALQKTDHLPTRNLG